MGTTFPVALPDSLPLLGATSNKELCLHLSKGQCAISAINRNFKFYKAPTPQATFAEFVYNDTLYLYTLDTTRASTLVNFSCKSQNHCYSKSLAAAGGCYKLSQSSQDHPAPWDSKTREGTWCWNCHPSASPITFPLSVPDVYHKS